MSPGAGARVGIGTPGSPSPRDDRIRNANSTCLNGQPLQHDLEALLRRLLRLANDANRLAMSEAADGAGAGAGTGVRGHPRHRVGGGIVVDGRLLVGANAVAGEWGHNPLPLPDSGDLPLPVCYCGRAAASRPTCPAGPGRRSPAPRRRALSTPRASPAAPTPASAPARPASNAKRGSARALAGVINLLDPEVIVLGGGLSQVARLYENAPRLWPAHVFPTPSPPACCRQWRRLGRARGLWLWPAD